MKNIYYNKFEFLKAQNKIYTDPLYSKVLFEEYLKKYPKDYSAQSYYVYNLIILGYLKEAENYLNKIEMLSKTNKAFMRSYNKSYYLEKGITLNKIRIYLRLKEYKKLYEYYLSLNNEIENQRLYVVPFYCKKKLGLLDEKKEYSSYLFNQIAHYSEDKFTNHILKHTADYNMNLDNPNSSIFKSDFPIENIIQEIKKIIPSNEALYYGFFDNTYVFKYNECGRDKNRLVDYFKLICFHDDNNLITMYPSENCENLPFIDLNYLNKEKPKIKSLTQIEKFNRRYKRK